MLAGERCAARGFYMESSSPFLEGKAPTVYIEGSREEAERLFGGRIPVLPAGELGESGEVIYYVQHHPRLQPLARDYVAGLFRELSPGVSKRGTAKPSGPAEDKYSSLLQRTLVATLLQDRRIGLVNLFWLSHTKEIAEAVSSLSCGDSEIAGARFAMHPLLARFLRNIWRSACLEVDRSRPGHLNFVLGPSFQFSLVDAVIDDQLPLTLNRLADVNFSTFFNKNSRYRISLEVFSEVCNLLLGEIGQRLESQDPLLIAKIARHLPTLKRENYAQPALRTKLLFNPGVRRHLLSDHWRLGARLAGSRSLQAEVKKGLDPLASLEAIDELCDAVQRFELISRVRESVHLIPSVMSEAQIQETYRTARLYRFTESVETTGNAVNATVMFLDLRGFTKTSEGMVSERDLTRQLYTVFDPFIEIISRFGGQVDKFLGDGMMVTFGAVHSSRYGPINAVRTAILLQERIQQLREEAKTDFTMGVSIHHGRVYLAHFIGSADGQDSTVIGRNVNVAGRLSSAAKGAGRTKSGDAYKGDRRDPASSSSRVEVDRRGNLINEGIAISREAVQALEKVIPLTRQDEVEDLYGELYDAAIEKNTQIHYVGDAKFKGVWGSFPVYSVVYD